jgi:hypothetical protein
LDLPYHPVVAKIMATTISLHKYGFDGDADALIEDNKYRKGMFLMLNIYPDIKPLNVVAIGISNLAKIKIPKLYENYIL